MQTSSIPVSVVITTRNEEGAIGSCLQSLMQQSYPKESLEVLVVDNGSADATKEIARRLGVAVYDKGPERSAQRNFGAAKAGGTYILYLDADMALSEGVIEECVNRCASEGLAGLYIPERIRGAGFWSRVRDFERSFYDATCIDCVRFVRRDAFLELGGFDERLTGPEDWDFDRRLRQRDKVGIIRAVLYHDEGSFELKRYLRKKEYYAQSFDAYVEKWGRSDPEIRKQLGAGYRYFGVFFEKGKWVKLIRHPVLAAGMYFLRAAVGLAYVLRCKKIKPAS